jgi:hypothetical protein
VTTHPHQEAEVFVFLTVCGIGDSPIGIVVVWLIAKKDFTMIYISKYVINIELYLQKVNKNLKSKQLGKSLRRAHAK